MKTVKKMMTKYLVNSIINENKTDILQHEYCIYSSNSIFLICKRNKKYWQDVFFSRLYFKGLFWSFDCSLDVYLHVKWLFTNPTFKPRSNWRWLRIRWIIYALSEEKIVYRKQKGYWDDASESINYKKFFAGLLVRN